MSSYNSTLEEIKSRLDIIDVISEYIPLRKAGQNWKGLCPFHSEKTPSFIVSPSKQIYHCFGCGSGGDIFTFINKYEGLSFKESIDILAKKAGVELKKFQRHDVNVEEKENLLTLHRDASIFFQEILKQNQKALDYLKDRGISANAQKLFSIGYAPDAWDNLFSYLKKKGYTIEIIKKAGLITHGTKGYYDTFRDRIIFPIFDLRGEIIAFGGRVMDDSMPKYLNSPETPIFNKSRVLYGLNLAKESIKKEGFAIFVEGYIDVITTHMYGFTNTVAPLGTALTHKHGKLIKRFIHEAILVFDGDPSGIKAAKNGISILLESGLNVKVLLLPAGEDPDSLLRKKGAGAFANLLSKAVDIVDFFVMQDGTDSYRKEDKHLIAHDALETISKIPDSVLQGHYVKLLSDKLKINELFIREELWKIKRRLQPKGAFSDKHTSVSETQTKARPQEEMYLLQLIIQFPEMAQEIFNAVSTENFEDTVVATVFEKIKAKINSSRNVAVNYSALVSECDEAERNLLTELLVKTEFEEPEKVLKDCLKRLRFKKRQILLHELQNKIKKADLEKNDSLLRVLLLEKQKLLREG